MKSNLVSYTDAETALRFCLEEVPFITVQQLGVTDLAYPSLDLQANLLVGDRPIVIFGVIMSDGTLRTVRGIAARISSCLERVPLKSYGVIIAPYISEDSGAILHEQGVGYVDLTGNYQLCFDQVYMHVRTGEKPVAVKQALRSIYSPKASRVLRVLLDEPGKVWRVQEMAESAGISLGMAWKVKDHLCAREWLKMENKELVLIKPEALLKEWALNYRPVPKENVYDFYSFLSPSEVEFRLAEICKARGIAYALAEFSGGARYAPVVRYTRASAYVGERVDEIADALQLKRVPSGANVRLIQDKDSGSFLRSREVESVKIVSPVQAYLDLNKISGRGEEAAEGVLKKEIEPKWR